MGSASPLYGPGGLINTSVIIIKQATRVTSGFRVVKQKEKNSVSTPILFKP